MVRASFVPAGVISDILVIERVNSVISVLGCLFILFTFCLCKAFDRPINRLIAFASAGNLMTNVATLMAGAPRDEGDAFLCQAQGFLIQMFMCADVLWTLAMAINVYLTFYHKFDASHLRQMEKWYFLGCYGVPFIPAVTFLFVEIPGKGRIYGDSMLWCWVTQEYDFLRIGTFYGPVWIVILVTGGIYVRAGSEIWKKRTSLTRMIKAGVKNYGNHQLNPYDLDAGMIYELEEAEDEYGRPHPVVNVQTLGRTLSAADKRFRAQRQTNTPLGPGMNMNTSVTVTSEVSTTVEVPLPAAPRPTYEYHIGTMPMFPSRPKPRKEQKRHRNNMEGRKTWQGPTKYGPKFISTQIREREWKEEEKNQERLMYQIMKDPNKNLVRYQANRAAWGYTKVSAMFFAAMLITWVPSSANRVWSALNSGDISIPLTYASAFVLPLQGMWNCIIYCITSSAALRDLMGNLGLVMHRRRLEVKEYRDKEEDEVEMMQRRSGVLEDLEGSLGRRSTEIKRGNGNGRPHSKYSQSTLGSVDGRHFPEPMSYPKATYDPTDTQGGEGDIRSSRSRSNVENEARGANGGHSIGSILKQERVARSSSVESGAPKDLYERRARSEAGKPWDRFRVPSE